MKKKIGLGTWSWGNEFFWNYKSTSDEELYETFIEALRQGFLLIDTADSYGTGSLAGRSEKLIGQFLKRTANSQKNKIKIDIPNIDLPTIAGGGPFLGNWAGNPLAEGDVLPIVRIDPQWPREALVEGIEGYVIVEVLIAADGSVASAVVVESVPRRMFDRNVIRAVLKWKFKPRIVNGVPVERRAIQRLDFNLDDLS